MTKYPVDTTKTIDQLTLSDFNSNNGNFTAHCWLPFQKHIKKIVDYSREISGKEEPLILDVACGNGLVSKLMVQEGAQVFAIDYDKELLDKTPHKHENIKYYPLPIESFASFKPFKDYFDTIYCGYMDLDHNWVPLIHSLNPKMIVYVNGPSVGLDPYAFQENEHYKRLESESAINSINLLKTFKNYNKKEFEIFFGSFVIFHLRKDIMKQYGEKLKQKKIVFSVYKWEQELAELTPRKIH